MDAVMACPVFLPIGRNSMKPHTFRYYVYDKHGGCVFESSYRYDAMVWAEGNGNTIIRKDLLGNYPNKKIV